NRDGAGCLLQCRNDWRAAGDNQVRCLTHQFRGISLDSSEIAAGKPMLDLNVAFFRPSERLKSLAKRLDAGLYLWIVLGERVQEQDARSRRGMLRRSSGGACQSRAPNQRDDLPPLCMTGKEHCEGWR